jgi:hypothetical protein
MASPTEEMILTQAIAADKIGSYNMYQMSYVLRT